MKACKILVVLLAFLLVIPSAASIKAEDVTLKEKLDESNNFHWVSETMGIEEETLNLTDHYQNFDPAGTQFSEGKTYEIVYKNVFGSSEDPNICLKLSFEVLRCNGSLHRDVNRNGIKVLGDGHVAVGSYYTTDVEDIAEQWDYTTNYKITYAYYMGDPGAGGTLYNFDCLVGIIDTDNANYLFDTSSNVYFKDATGQEDWNTDQVCSEEFLVKDDGIYRNLETSIRKFSDTDIRLGGFGKPRCENDPELYVMLLNDSSYEFEVHGWRDIVNYPFVYKINKYTVTYKDGVDGTVFPDDVNPGLMYGVDTPTFTPPERPGYVFVGWDKEVKDIVTEDAVYIAQWKKIVDYKVEYYYQVNGNYPETPDSSVTRQEVEGKTVNATDTDKTPQKENYVLDSAETKNVWTETVKEDGSTVLKVYFKESLTVIYQPGTQGTFPEQKDEKLDYGVATPAAPDTSSHNEGYDFDGWAPEVEPTVTKNAVYVAQWKPWTYTIEYDANTGSGEMDPHVYVFADETMPSDANKFWKDGYKFVGFKYKDVHGTEKLCTSTADFKEDLIARGPYGKVLLIAQWEKIPVTPTVYTPPTTGVE